MGPTAVGKTTLAIQLAQWLKTEIISADSRQFYQEMGIGTAKPGQEELDAVIHHFINSRSINSPYSAGEFGRDALNKIARLHKKNRTVLVVGGSGLYLKALWDGFDDIPEVKGEIRNQLNEELESSGLDQLLEELKESDPIYFDQVDKQNGQRVVRSLEVIRGTEKPFSSYRMKKKYDLPYDNLKIGLNMDREILFEKINRRMDQMIEAGLFEEAEGLYRFKDHNALRTVGYSEIYGFMDDHYDKEEAIRLLKRNSRRYAKRQLTWFGKYDDINWFELDEISKVKELIEKVLS